jgi:catechol 2,3-dioxygenase-like lactoylglutathione lyase family enzyme
MINALFPVLCSRNVAAARDFYVRLFGFRVVFDADWYVQLLDPGTPAVQLGFVAHDHETVPPRFRALPRGVLVTVEVDDVDAVFARARDLGLSIEMSLRDEEFGQRHFMTVDPDGLLVDVVKVIPFTERYADAYAVGAAGSPAPSASRAVAPEHDE